MARFQGRIKGSRGEASRLGHATSGLRVEANGWHSGIKVYAEDDNESDLFQIVQTLGSSGGDVQEIGRVRNGKLYLFREAVESAEIIE